MIRRVFEWREDPELGDCGWIMKGQPTFNAGNGALMAHDILEHVTGKYGSVTDEFVALGALIQVRGEGDWWSNFSSASYSQTILTLLRSEATRLWQDMLSGSERLEPIRRSLPIDSGFDQDILEAVDDMPLSVVEEFGYSKDNSWPDAVNQEQERRAIAWMRRGYRLACRRYPNHTGWQLANLFNELATSIDRIGRHGDFGLELHVNVNRLTGGFQVALKETYED